MSFSGSPAGLASGATASPSSSSPTEMDRALEAGLPASVAQASIDLRVPVYALLRCAFHAARNGGSGDGTDHDTRDAVGSVCAMARANDIRPETLILAIKGGWWQLPESRGMSRMDAELTLAGLITLCIKEYYAPESRL